MTSITRTAVYLALSLTILVGSASTAFAASEVTGTLSSDGSSSATPTYREESNNTLTGSVIGGTEDPTTAVLGVSQESTMWGWALITLALMVMTGVGYHFYMRRYQRNL